MMNNNGTTKVGSNKLLIFGISLYCGFWLVASFIDTYFSKEENTFVDSVFMPGPIELLIRFVVLVMVILIIIYARKTLILQHHINEDLADHKSDLELEIKEQTQDLQ